MNHKSTFSNLCSPAAVFVTPSTDLHRCNPDAPSVVSTVRGIQFYKGVDMWIGKYLKFKQKWAYIMKYLMLPVKKTTNITFCSETALFLRLVTWLSI